MELIIYTTYATAMRHRPEDIAASGGLQPSGMMANPPRVPRPRPHMALARMRCWLGSALVGVGTRLQGMPGADEIGVSPRAGSPYA